MIPDGFELMGRKWLVLRENSIAQRMGRVGECDHTLGCIRLQDESATCELPESFKEQVFYHELVHAILGTMYEKELCDNEKFVDLFASLLQQALDTFHKKGTPLKVLEKDLGKGDVKKKGRKHATVS